jgi:predicted dehydrogenase
MANSVEDCTAMIDACKAAGKRLMIAYRQQYEPYNRETVRLYRSGELGKPVALFATNGQNQDDPKQWRENLAMAGGGSLVDVGVNCLNAARFITGEEPVEIVAQQSSDRSDPRFREIEDKVLFSLRFPSGFVANLMCFYSGHGTQYLRVTGSKQWVEMSPAFGYHGLQLRVARSDKESDRIEQIVLSDVDQFANEIDHFSRCIQENREPHTPGEEGRQDIFLIKKIYEAVSSGRAVSIPPVDRLDAFRGSEPTY